MTQGPYGASHPNQGAPPRCKNHPDRITYVACQRCGQPICPDCSVPAAVGLQCTNCVKEGKKQTAHARTVTGAKLVTGRPLITMSIIGISVFTFALQLILGWDAFTARFAFAPFLAESEPWRFLTGALLHSPSRLFHILFNMYALWVVGSQLEYLLGRWRFLTLYILSAVGGNVMVLLLANPITSTGSLDPSWATATIGASGAVFGLFGALLPVIKRLGGQTKPILVIIGLNAVIGFIIPNISWQGHLGGLLVGALLGWVYVKAPRDKSLVYAIGASVAVFVLLATLATWKINVSSVFSWFG